MRIRVFFDGACKNVKDSITEPYGIGVAVYVDDIYRQDLSHYSGGLGTSNIAEWEALLKASQIVAHYYLEQTQTFTPKNIEEIEILGDSQLIVRQFNGEYQITAEHLKKYLRAVQLNINKFNPSLKVIWIRREKNTKADELSKLGLEEIKQRIENEKIS